jgi:hypothetical protein
MEQPWGQLGGNRFPADVSVGDNWGKASNANPQGLKDIHYRPLTSTWDGR